MYPVYSFTGTSLVTKADINASLCFVWIRLYIMLRISASILFIHHNNSLD